MNPLPIWADCEAVNNVTGAVMPAVKVEGELWSHDGESSEPYKLGPEWVEVLDCTGLAVAGCFIVLMCLFAYVVASHMS